MAADMTASRRAQQGPDLRSFEGSTGRLVDEMSSG